MLEREIKITAKDGWEIEKILCSYLVLLEDKLSLNELKKIKDLDKRLTHSYLRGKL